MHNPSTPVPDHHSVTLSLSDKREFVIFLIIHPEIHSDSGLFFFITVGDGECYGRSGVGEREHAAAADGVMGRDEMGSECAVEDKDDERSE